ncbi:MAG: hypothetical protein OQK11_08730 [Thiovulaceae bacterium]|nr:hypothetical protein [Sulfurimonadaceae bacterium]
MEIHSQGCNYGNDIGIQTGISSQIEVLQENSNNLNIHMHSQGNIITSKGAKNTDNGHSYNSYGSPIGDDTMNSVFKNDIGDKPIVQKNDGDYVSYPLNIFDPSTYSLPGHPTENYGTAKAKKEKALIK